VMTCFSAPCFDICLQIHSGAPCFIICAIRCKRASPFSQYCCKNCVHISMHAHLCSSVSCFGIHLAQILWYPLSLWVMEYADPQLMSSLLAIPMREICLFSWTRALIHSSWSDGPSGLISNAYSPTLEPFHPFVHLPSCITVFSIFC
jgi:hypothetical protein